MTLYVNSDGGSRGNPGHAACAFVVTDENDNIIFQWKKYLGIRTNNQAEYMGVIMALKWLTLQQQKMKIEKVVYRLDSELIVKQLSGEYKVKSKLLQPYVKKVKELQNELNFTFEFKHIYRNLNTQADFLVNVALDEITEGRK